MSFSININVASRPYFRTKPSIIRKSFVYLIINIMIEPTFIFIYVLFHPIVQFVSRNAYHTKCVRPTYKLLYNHTEWRVIIIYFVRQVLRSSVKYTAVA